MSAQAKLSAIERVGLVPVVRTADKELALRAARALVRGGVSVVEITLTVPGALAAIAELKEELSENAVVGAGTVRTVKQARECLAAGAEFIVSPGFVPEVVDAVVASDTVMVPGALTPSEVMSAWERGSHLVKIFPCSAVGGASYLRALAAPLPEVKLLPSGGITLETVSDFVAAGAAALGVGGELVQKAALERGDDDEVTRRAEAFLIALRNARSEA